MNGDMGRDLGKMNRSLVLWGSLLSLLMNGLLDLTFELMREND